MYEQQELPDWVIDLQNEVEDLRKLRQKVLDAWNMPTAKEALSALMDIVYELELEDKE